MVIKVPNQVGTHTATYITKYKLKEKKTHVTQADISPDCKTIVLLNYDRIWTLTNFKTDNFFDGTIKSIDLIQDVL
ncbi:MAG: hypothetical protein WBF67_10700 [Olleya sp.]